MILRICSYVTFTKKETKQTNKIHRLSFNHIIIKNRVFFNIYLEHSLDGRFKYEKKNLNNSKLKMQNEHRKKYLYPYVPKMSQQGSTLKGRALY